MRTRLRVGSVSLALAGVLAALSGCMHYVDRPVDPVATAAAFDRRTLDDPDLRAFLRQNAARDSDDTTIEAWTFETLSWVAFYYHPSLDVARSRWTSLVAGQTTASERPNPTVIVTPGFNSNAGGISPWFPAINFDLPIETAGKRGYRLAKARNAAEAARQAVFAAAWQVRSNLRRALVAWTNARARFDLLQRQIEAERRIVELVEQRRRAGATTALETAAARLTLWRSDADAGDANRQIAFARQDLAEALGMPASALERFAPADDAFGSAIPRNERDLAGLRSVAMRHRPDILAALADYESAQNALQLEIARQYPDLRLGPGYQWDQGASKWSIALAVDLPILNRNRGPIAEAEARRLEAGARFRELQANVAAMIDRGIAELGAAEARLASVEQIAAAVERQHERQSRRLQTGDIDRLEYQIARRELGLAQLSAADARGGVARAAAELEAALQVPFPNVVRVIESVPISSP